MQKNKDKINASLSHLSYEDRLILCCIQSDSARCSPDEITYILSQLANWDEVLEAAEWHTVTPLLYKTLIRIQDRTDIPDYVTDRLEAVYKANVARNMYLFSEFKIVIAALKQKDVEVIVLKGAALASEMYGDIGLRQMSDIDLLIKKEDLPLAESALSTAGYLPSHIHPPEWLRENYHHVTYSHPDRNIPVELHWHISHQSQPGPGRIHDNEIIKQWWMKAEPTDIHGRKVHILCAEHLLIHLALHFIKHRFQNRESEYKVCFISRGALSQLCDIILTIRKYKDKINWEKLRIEAKECGLEEVLYMTLYLVKEIAGEDHLVRSKLNDFLPDTFDTDIAELMLKKIFIREASFPPVTKLMIKSFGENNFREGMKNIFRIMFPSPEILSDRYSVPVNSIKLYLCYLIRPFDVLFRHRKTISEVPRIKDDAALTRWICSQGTGAKGNN